MSRSFRILVAALGCLVAASALGQSVRKWSTFLDSAQYSIDQPLKIVNAGSGTYYVFGDFNNSGFFGNDLWANATSYVMKVVAPGVFQWSSHFGGSLLDGEANPTGGAAFVTIYYHRVEVVSVDAQGNRRWTSEMPLDFTRTDDGTMNSNARDGGGGVRVLIDGPGNIYVSNPYAPGTSQIWKFAPDGTLIWKTQLPGAPSIFHDVFLDTGGIVVAGSQDNHNVVARFSLDGTLVWTTTLPSSGLRDTVSAIVPNHSGGMLATARVRLTATDWRADFYKLGSDGSVQWQKTIDNLAPLDHQVAAAPAGNLAAMVIPEDGFSSVGKLILIDALGSYKGFVQRTNHSALLASLSFGFDSKSNLYYGTDNFTLTKYTSAGQMLWTDNWNGVAYNYGFEGVPAPSIVVDEIDRILATVPNMKNALRFVDNEVLSYKPDQTRNWIVNFDSGHPSEESMLRSLTDKAGNTFTIGKVSSNAIPGIKPTTTNIIISRFTPNGAAQWSVQLHPADFVDLTNAVLMPDGGLLVNLSLYNSQGLIGSVLIRKYDTSGTVQWEKSIPLRINLATDAAGNIYLGATENNTSLNLWKLDGNGNTLWTATKSGEMSGAVLATDGTRLYAGTTTLVNNGLTGDSTVFAYSVNGTFLWSHTLLEKGYSDSGIAALLTDHVGNVVASAFSRVQGKDLPLIYEYDSAGAFRWGCSLRPPGVTSYKALDMALDSANNIVHADWVQLDPGTNELTLDVQKVSANGSLLWTKNPPYYTSGSNYTHARILIDNANRIFVATSGYNEPTAVDSYVLKLAPDGSPLWPMSGGPFQSGRMTVDHFHFDDLLGDVGMDASGDFYVAQTAFGPSGSVDLNLVRLTPRNSAPSGQTIAASMTAGQTYTVTVTMTNTGADTWAKADGFQLRSMNGATWTTTSVDLGTTDAIAPGQSKKFSFRVVAPATGGAYPMQWTMAKDGIPFGTPSTLANVSVSVRQNAAYYVSQTIPTTVKAGSTFTVKVTMKNVGTTTWSAAAGQQLATTDPDMNAIWQTVTVPLAPTDAIAQSQQKTFTFTCRAPATPGNYTIRWRMYRSAPAFTGFFGDKTTTKTIAVTP